MLKYDYKLKKKIVKEYLSGKNGYHYLAKKYNIPQHGLIRRWVNAYHTFGDEGLKPSRKNQTYSFEFKLHVVELYLTTDLSYQDVAIKEKITNPSVITNWVSAYRTGGPDALKPKQKGTGKLLKSNRKKENPVMENNIKIDVSSTYIKELEEELLKLRIENAYLKELRRLRLEEEALLKKQRESSTASEESSN